MPVVIACSACQGKLSVPESLSGKAVKCPKCGQAIRVTAGDGAAAPRPPASVKVAPAPGAPAAEAPITVNCGSCQKKLQVKATYAGKAVRCPGCGNPVKIPAPSAPSADAEEWMEVNEAAAPAPAPPAGKKDSGPAGEWGQEHLQQVELPEDMQDEIHAEMTKTERVVWATRPRVDILLHRARKVAYIAGPLCGVVSLGATVVVVICLINGVYLGLIGLVFALLFGFGSWYTFRMPGQVIKYANRRACYALTNRRLLIHRGELAEINTGGGGAAVNADPTAMGKIVPYTGLELTTMCRVEAGARFEGAGDLVLGRNAMQQSAGLSIQAVDKVRDCERTIREKLLHPVIDRLLRGEALSGEEKAKAKDKSSKKEEGDVIGADNNIKEYAGSKRQAPTIDPDDPNIKDAPGAVKNLKGYFEACLKAVPAQVRETVEAELTVGEKILWIGRPEAGAQGRGFVGAMMGSAHRYEPPYTHYAITNRRVLLFSTAMPVPSSHYTPALLEAGVEDDDRIPKGGSIVFRRIKRITISRDNNGKTTRTEEIHSFGILRIRNYQAVAALMYDTLIGPVKGL
jgi:hypothetical protein